MAEYERRTTLVLLAITWWMLSNAASFGQIAYRPPKIQHKVIYATPDAVFEASHAALLNHDWQKYLSCLTLDAQKDLIFEVLFGLRMVNSKEVDAICNTYIANYDKLNDDYKVRSAVPRGAQANEHSNRALLCDMLFERIADKAGFIDAAIKQDRTDLQSRASKSPRKIPALKNVRVDGDTATGIVETVTVSIGSTGDGKPNERVETIGPHTVHFRKINDTWLLESP